MSQTKRVLCLHDLACVGRCSLGVAAPALSAMGVQACLLPVALLSTHTGGFGVPACAVQTAFCENALAHFTAQDIAFDAIYSGYLSGAAQAELVCHAFAQSPAAFRFVDPVLGDGGALYHAVTPALCAAMQALCAQADCIVPNVTESAVLLDLPPSEDPLDADALLARCLALSQRFPHVRGIVITGVHHANGQWGNACWELSVSHAPLFLPFTRTPQAYPGTGDLFASVLLGASLHGEPLPRAAARAADFVAAATAATYATAAPPRFGVAFEPLLGQLTLSHNNGTK